MKRRHFLQCSGMIGLGLGHFASSVGQENEAKEKEVLIDVHQHINYSGRTNDDLIKHQETLGIAKSVLLPAGSVTLGATTHEGRSNGLAARIFGTAAAAKLAVKHPDKFVYFANEVPDLPGATKSIENWLKKGACGIGEQKFNIAIDSPEMMRIYELAREFKVPVLLHIEHDSYNHGFDRFHKVLEKFPTVNFIGHAQTWWGNIDKKHEQAVMYPKTKVSKGGLTDRLLSDYSNVFGDLSAGSGLNSMTRDLEHAADFLHRHQDKLMLGTDCNDSVGHGSECSGAEAIKTVRALVPDASVRSKVFAENAKKVIKL